MIAGQGARDARDELVALAEAFNVGVYAAFRRQDVFPNEHSLYLGHLTLGTPPDTLRALEEADLVLVIGCRLDEVTTQGYRLPRAGAAVIQVDVDPGVVGVVVSVERGVVADVRGVLSALVAQAPSPLPARDWTAAHQAYLDSSSIPAGRTTDGIDPAQVIAALRDVLPEDALLANDAGNFPAFLHRYWRYNHPQTQLAPANGAMGYGVPAAVAAKLAAPERCVVACCGDGGFLMTGQELETAVRGPDPRDRLSQRDARDHRHAPDAPAGAHRRHRDRGGGPRPICLEPGRRRLHGTRHRRIWCRARESPRLGHRSPR
jgi:acetolactate synthase I/II/III large subunit